MYSLNIQVLSLGHWTHLGGVGGDGVEDVDQHQEQRDQESHAARDNVRGDNKTGTR